MLEQDSGIHLQGLANLFDIKETQLSSVEPSRNFFTNLAHTKGGIKLVEIKRLIEQDLHLKSIFPPIGKAISEKRLEFTLESTLAELHGNGQNWFYFLENVADKLSKNTFRLPSWRDIADYYNYDYNEIEHFSTNVKQERTTVKLFRHLVAMENVPTISTLKKHLRTLNRNDVIRKINEMLPLTNEQAHCDVAS